MLRILIRYSWLFIVLVLFQVLVLNNMHMSIYLNPYVYILIIMILPFETPGWLVLTTSFFTGLIMDAFSNTPGMHSAALVSMGFVRQYLLQLMAPRDGYETGHYPNYGDMGFTWFLIYSGILTLIHHVILFSIEDFSLTSFFSVLFRSILSAIFTIALIFIIMLAYYKPRR